MLVLYILVTLIAISFLCNTAFSQVWIESFSGGCPNAATSEAREKYWEHHDDRGCDRLTSKGQQKCEERHIYDVDQHTNVYCEWDDDKCKFADVCDGDAYDDAYDDGYDDGYDEGDCSASDSVCEACPNASSNISRLWEHDINMGCDRLTSKGQSKCESRYIKDVGGGDFVLCKWSGGKCVKDKDCKGDSPSPSPSSSTNRSSGGTTRDLRKQVSFIQNLDGQAAH